MGFQNFHIYFSACIIMKLLARKLSIANVLAFLCFHPFQTLFSLPSPPPPPPPANDCIVFLSHWPRSTIMLSNVVMLSGSLVFTNFRMNPDYKVVLYFHSGCCCLCFRLVSHTHARTHARTHTYQNQISESVLLVYLHLPTPSLCVWWSYLSGFAALG